MVSSQPLPTSESSPRSSREPQRPPPAPLGLRNDSHNIRKQPSVAPPQPSSPKDQQRTPPLIIYDLPPKIIRTNPESFKDVVQRLTCWDKGPPSSSAASTSNGASSANGDELGGGVSDQKDLTILGSSAAVNLERSGSYRQFRPAGTTLSNPVGSLTPNASTGTNLYHNNGGAGSSANVGLMNNSPAAARYGVMDQYNLMPQFLNGDQPRQQQLGGGVNEQEQVHFGPSSMSRKRSRPSSNAPASIAPNARPPTSLFSPLSSGANPYHWSGGGSSSNGGLNAQGARYAVADRMNSNQEGYNGIPGSSSNGGLGLMNMSPAARHRVMDQINLYQQHFPNGDRTQQLRGHVSQKDHIILGSSSSGGHEGSNSFMPAGTLQHGVASLRPNGGGLSSNGGHGHISGASWYAAMDQMNSIQQNHHGIPGSTPSSQLFVNNNGGVLSSNGGLINASPASPYAGMDRMNSDQRFVSRDHREQDYLSLSILGSTSSQLFDHNNNVGGLSSTGGLIKFRPAADRYPVTDQNDSYQQQLSLNEDQREQDHRIIHGPTLSSSQLNSNGGGLSSNGGLINMSPASGYAVMDQMNSDQQRQQLGGSIISDKAQGLNPLMNIDQANNNFMAAPSPAENNNDYSNLFPSDPSNISLSSDYLDIFKYLDDLN